MSLQVSNLTKIYGQQKAVNNISFAVHPGEIVGFLGPNGAGKSTTMKISTGYLPPTSGQVVVNGLDVTTHPLKVRKMLGYLPENNPLYLDMYVHEYLHFVGEVFGLSGRQLKNRVGEIILLCGLEREQNKRIEQLSKGFRQRVGLAQALIHNPQVLVLDEPTTGLDPNQILEIRKLIKEISVSKTVIFSTHIMQEVQAICSRVVVINQGELVADAPVAELLQSQPQVQVIVEFGTPIESTRLAAIAGVQQVAEVAPGTFKLTAAPGVDLRPEVFRFATENNLSLVGLQQVQLSLEEIFRSLTANTPQV
ncbi:MAG: gliding motility-associated ABC transporter ATP-binding subunit GldA [Cyclobacteriaceae bacterium]|nr:gliding motility-associated ABC transporter ATP-binding subunit GldA [Cyclobacteriaceae bacterium]